MMSAENGTQTTKAGLLSRLALAAAALLAALSPLPAAADANPANDSAAITIHLQPVVDLGVLVDTTGAAWAGSADLDTAMDLGAEKLLGTGVKVTVVGTFNVQELELQGAALNQWTLGADESDSPDALRLYALFGADGAAGPASSDFAGAQNLITASSARAGQPQSDEGGDANHVYELPVAHASYADVDNMRVNAVRRLWLRANTPSFSTQDSAQGFTVTVTAVSGAAQ